MHSRINRGHAAADHHHIAPHGQAGQIIGLAQIGDEIDGIQNTRTILARSAQRVDAAQTHAKKHRVIIGAKPVKRQIAPKRTARMQRDAADLHQPIKLRPGKAIRRLIGRDAIFIQAAPLGSRIEQIDLMALHCQAMRASQTRRASAHDGHALACLGRAAKGMHTRRHHPVGGVALQSPDLDRFALGRLAHTGLFAKRFGRADARAHAAQNILVEDRLGRRLRGARGDLADEQRDVDGRGACRDAGRVMAEITPISGHQRLMGIEWRMQIGEVFLQDPPIEPRRHDPGGERAVRHRAYLPASEWRSDRFTLAWDIFFIKW